MENERSFPVPNLEIISMRPQKHPATNIVSTLILLLGGLLLFGCNQQQPQAPAQRPLPQITYVTMEPEKISLATELPGRTTAFKVADIRPQVSGLILKRLFREGAEVKAGQVLYQLDPEPFAAAMKSAEAALARARASLPSLKTRAERAKELVAVKAVSQQNYDDAAAALVQAEADIQFWQASLETARINLRYTKVKAPISGRIGKSNVSVGAIVTAYQPMPLATIQQLDPIYVDIPQSTTNLLRLKRRLEDGRLIKGEDHNKVRLIQEDGTLDPHEGVLQFSDISVDPGTGSVTLRALFPNPDADLFPGMYVQTLIQEGINEQALLVPQQGIARDPKGNPYALLVGADNMATFRPLTLDRAIDDRWLVAAGLSPGDKVIVEGLTLLRPGTKVQASPFVSDKKSPDTAMPSAAAK